MSKIFINVDHYCENFLKFTQYKRNNYIFNDPNNKNKT